MPLRFQTRMHVSDLRYDLHVGALQRAGEFAHYYRGSSLHRCEDRSENSRTNAYQRIVRIVRIHFFMKTRYACVFLYSFHYFDIIFENHVNKTSFGLVS